MKLATTPGYVSPRLAAAQASRRTEQQARYARVLHLLRDRRLAGHRTVTITVSDLEALIALAASTDLALDNGAIAAPVAA